MRGKVANERVRYWWGKHNKAKRTAEHLIKTEMLLNSADKLVSITRHEKGLKQYAVLQPWRDHLNAFRKEHPEMSLKEQMKAASKTYKKKKTTKSAKSATKNTKSATKSTKAATKKTKSTTKKTKTLKKKKLKNAT